MPPSVRYYNQTAPFWDFVASMEDQGPSHPFFAANNNNNRGDVSDNDNGPSANPFEGGWGFPFGPFAHRGRHGQSHHNHGPPHHHRGPSRPDQSGPQQPPSDHEDPHNDPEKEHDPEEGSSHPRDQPPPFSEEGPHHGPGPHRGPGGHRGRCGGRGRGGWGGRGRGGPFGHRGPAGALGGLAEMFQSQLFGDDNNNNNKSAEDFKPEADVFDAAESFVIHVSLPGAKKEDVGVNWDAEKSELSIAGVIYRPGDEEFLKTLALDERKVGAFERKLRLGSRANPAQVDVDGITARMEDGILRIEVPKLDSGYVEIKKVDIE